ncbi:MAG: ABC transporter permease, partial [Burkholderiales bacterium]
MNLTTLSASYLRARPLNTLLSLILLALGVGTIVLLILVVSQLEERMHRDARGIDLVVGAKGSPMQLMLSGIYHLDAPTGNIPLAEAQALEKHRLIKKSMPLALGDSWKGHRIVGATHAYPEHYGAKLASGRLWEKAMEAVLGAEVAARTGVQVGDTFTGVHGLGGEGGDAHAEDRYQVVGVLERTGSVIDRLVLCNIESVWQVHEHAQGPQDDADRKALEEAREVTVLLVQYASPLAAATLPRQINSQSELQAASPAYETARLFRIVGVGVEALRAFAVVLILAAGLSVFIALYTALEERRYDLAVMRTLGASPGKLFGLLMTEGIVLSLAGALIGLVLGHG